MSRDFAWGAVLIAGILEIVFALSLGRSNGFTRLWPTVTVVVIAVFSLFMLSQAVRVLPIGTVYAVWTGIGSAGTALIGLLYLREPATALRIISLILIVVGVIGLRLGERSR